METAEAPPPPRTKAPVPSLLIDASGKSCDRALEGAAKSSNCTEARRGGGTRGGSSLEAESAHGQVRPALDMRWEVEVRYLPHPPWVSPGGDATGARRERAGRARVCSEIDAEGTDENDMPASLVMVNYRKYEIKQRANTGSQYAVLAGNHER